MQRSCIEPRAQVLHWALHLLGPALAVNIKTMGLCGPDLCECGKVQTTHHILQDCIIFKPPYDIYQLDNPALLYNNLLTQSSHYQRRS